MLHFGRIFLVSQPYYLNLLFTGISMKLIIKQVQSKQDLSQFIFLPATIHKNHPQWIPPIWMDEKVFFNPEKNKAFAHCNTILLLALKDEKPVGRIMGIVHRDYNALRNEKNCRFGFLECFDDPEVSTALLNKVEQWGREQEMTRMIGPYGFSDKDPQGLLIEGFEHLAVIASNCNHPYLVSLLEQAGYSKEIDCLAFRLPVNVEIPEVHRRIYERAARNESLEVVDFSTRKQLKPWIIPILELMNECYADIYGFIPLTAKEMKDFAGRYMPVIEPRFVKIVVRNNELLSFVVGLPNFSRGLQKSGGYILPFGIFHILRSMKRTKQLDLMLGGVKPSCQGLGLDLLMGFKLLDSAKSAGFEQIEVHLILETNYKMLAEVQKLNAIPHKRFRVFHKDL